MKHRPKHSARAAKPVPKVYRRNETEKPTEDKAQDKINELPAFILGAFKSPRFILGLIIGYLLNHLVFRPLFFS